ncbi:MAG TPA: hypothetical protein VIQ02_14065 [Jiangellaceae bacterium]
MTRRCLLQAALCAIILVMFTACSTDDPMAQPANGWVTVTDEPSGARIALPEKTKPASDTAADANGSQVTFRQYEATAAGGAVEVGFNVLDTRGGTYDLDTGVREVATSLHGQVVSARPTDIDGHDAVNVEVSYGEDNVVLFQLVSADEHVLQPLVAGPASRRDVVEDTFEQLTESLDVGS